MKYNKPEITHLGDALSTIQGFGKPGSTYHDVPLNQDNASSTINAYEADE